MFCQRSDLEDKDSLDSNRHPSQRLFEQKLHPEHRTRNGLVYQKLEQNGKLMIWQL